ncbi:MAG: porin [Pseudomonadales bacterium]|nr:porin [Pseudomonadales bacterium]
MKKTVILCAASIVAAPQAFADLTIYGKVNFSAHMYGSELDGEASSENWRLQSNASRIGLKADRELNDNLKVIAKIEYEYGADGDTYGTDGDSVFKPRNIYAGFEGDWGQAIAGRTDTPVKLLGLKADVFNDYFLGDIKQFVSGENRSNDMLQYSSPRLGGFQATAMMQMGEESGVEDASQPEDSWVNSELASGYSSVLDYRFNSAVSVGLGVDHNIDGRDIVRVAGDWRLGNITFGAMVQNAEYSDAFNDIYTDVADEKAYVLSAKWQYDGWTVKAQWGESSVDVDLDRDENNSSAVVGVDYRFDKTTKVFGYYSAASYDDHYDEDKAAFTSFNENTIGVGMEFKF